MKRVILSTLAMGLIATSAMAEDAIQWPTATIGAERELEAEVNVVYGSIGYGITSLGVSMEDTASTSGQFNVQKYELDFNQPVGPVVLYMKNDFDDGFKHSETVVGAKITF
jgi:hypothetical protein